MNMMRNMDDLQKIQLRSPRESLGGYAVLPRLIDKARLLGKGRLPQEHLTNVPKPGNALDGRFFTYYRTARRMPAASYCF